MYTAKFQVTFRIGYEIQFKASHDIFNISSYLICDLKLGEAGYIITGQNLDHIHVRKALFAQELDGQVSLAVCVQRLQLFKSHRAYFGGALFEQIKVIA
jgi:hypothetical protein